MKRLYDKLLPFLPVLSLTLVYLAGGFGQATLIGEAKYLILGVVTLPLAAAIIVASIRIRREQKLKDKSL